MAVCLTAMFIFFNFCSAPAGVRLLRWVRLLRYNRVISEKECSSRIHAACSLRPMAKQQTMHTYANITYGTLVPGSLDHAGSVLVDCCCICSWHGWIVRSAAKQKPARSVLQRSLWEEVPLNLVQRPADMCSQSDAAAEYSQSQNQTRKGDGGET